jgi:hypothetical protein
MTAAAKTPEETYRPALEKARHDFAGAEPERVASRSGVRLEPTEGQRGRFVISFLNEVHWVYWPDGAVQRADDATPADVWTHIVLLHYLLTADGSPMADRWIAFRNLPGGLGYDTAFQGRASLRLARAFGSNRPAFEAAARSLGGERLSFGDASFSFRALPCLWLAAVLNVADDEFPAHASILFDAAASHYLPTEDLVVVGGLLAGRLIEASRAP